MAVGLTAPQDLKPVKGVRLAAVSADIYGKPRKDLVLLELGEKAQSACVFTQNLFCAAPVVVAKEHLAEHSPRFCLINAGNANAGTGASGLEHARQCCDAVARIAACDNHHILPFSTGVIGEALPAEKIQSSLPELFENLDENNWLDSANAIMTTDTIAKAISKQVEIDGELITITGMAKGSGMIRPDMATMLAYVATDAKIEQAILDTILVDAVNSSFNRITVDGDTSTNDACFIVATGECDYQIDEFESESSRLFINALNDVFIFLAQAIVRDGEGANKFITIEINGGQSEGDCLKVAYTIAHSPLVKTALFASDPNWGRILAAIGRSGIDLDVNTVGIWINDICIVEEGGVARSYSEQLGQKAMQEDEITIRVHLNKGTATTQIWTTDLSYDYVKINAEYRS